MALVCTVIVYITWGYQFHPVLNKLNKYLHISAQKYLISAVRANQDKSILSGIATDRWYQQFEK